MDSKAGLKAVALFEAAKGAVVLLAGVAAFELLRSDSQVMAEEFVRHLRLNPAQGLPRVFIDAAELATPPRLKLLAGGAFLYALVRFIEAYGLWRSQRWAEWFAAVSAAVYVPLEVWELLKGFSWLKALLVLLNLAIVGYMAFTLHRQSIRSEGPPR